MTPEKAVEVSLSEEGSEERRRKAEKRDKMMVELPSCAENVEVGFHKCREKSLFL